MIHVPLLIAKFTKESIQICPILCRTESTHEQHEDYIFQEHRIPHNQQMQQGYYKGYLLAFAVVFINKLKFQRTHLREREKDGFININNKTKQANGPKQSLFGLTTPIHIQIKQYEKEEKNKKEKKRKKKRKKKKKSITLHFNRNGFTLQKRQNKKKLKPLYQYRQNQNQHLGST